MTRWRDKALSEDAIIPLLCVCVAVGLVVWYFGYKACRSKHPEAAPWACVVNP